jgi:subtilisin-like proprotein convertase family protein
MSIRIALLAAMSLVLFLAPVSAEAQCPTRTVAVFDAPELPIPPAGTDGTTITTVEVTDAGYITAGDTSVSVVISHTWSGDLEIYLTSPSGTVALLRDNLGGATDDVIETYTKDVNGDDLSFVFDAEPVAGNWTLTVNDTLFFDAGTLHSWELSLTVGDDEDGDGFICGYDCDDSDPAINPDATEICDFIDNNCNGVADEIATSYYNASAPALRVPPTGTAGTTTDTITVGESAIFDSLSLSVNISHTWSGDLEISLTSPAGTTVMVRDNQGGSTDNVIETYFDLTDFAGEDAYGDWTLTVTDTFGGDLGTLNFWFIDAANLVADSDGDSVGELCDICPGTDLPEAAPTRELKPNHYALIDASGDFTRGEPKGKGGGSAIDYSTEDTMGCSCEQIIESLDLGNGQLKFGCSPGTMSNWAAQF